MVNSSTIVVLASYVPTQLSVELYPGGGVPWPQTVYGLLLDVGGAPLEGKPVRLLVNGALYGSTQTFPDGGWGFYNVAVGEGTYVFQAVFDGDDVYDPSSAEVSTVFQKVQAALSLDVAPTSGYVPLDVVIQGYLTRSDTGAGLGGRTVRIYKDEVLVAELTSSIQPATLGYFNVSDLVRDINTHSYYAQFLGDGQFAGCGDEWLTAT